MIKILTNGDIQCFLDYHPSISTDEYFELLSSLSHEERLSLCLSNKFSKAERNRQKFLLGELYMRDMIPLIGIVAGASILIGLLSNVRRDGIKGATFNEGTDKFVGWGK